MAFWNRNRNRVASLEGELRQLKAAYSSTQRFIRGLGVPGTENWSGYFQTDYNSDWNNNKYDKIPKMVNDAVIAGLLLAVKLPISQSTVSIEPASARRIDKKIADAVEKELFNNPTFTWSYLQDHILEFFEYGCAVFEKISFFSKEDSRWHFKLSPRLQDTLERWYLTPDGTLDYIEQHAMKGSTYEFFNLPNDKLSILTLNQRGSNYQGESILRPLYFNWYSKELLSKILTMASQIWGIKVPVIHLPEAEQSGDLEKAKTVGETYMSHQKQYIVAPSGFSVDAFGDTGGMPDIRGNIVHHNKEMVYRFLAMHIMAGMEGTGSYAMSKDKTDFFLLAEESYARRVEDFFNERVEGRAVIKDFVSWNFPNVTEYPKLNYSKIRSVDYEKLSNTLDKLANKRFIDPTEEIREMLLREMDLPAEQTIITQESKAIPEKVVTKKDDKRPAKEIKEPGKEDNEPDKKKATDCGCGHVHFADAGPFQFRRELTDRESSLANLEEIRDEIEDGKIETDAIGLKYKMIFIRQLMRKAPELVGLELKEFEKQLKKLKIDDKKLKAELKKMGVGAFHNSGKRVVGELRKTGVKLQGEPDDGITDEATIEIEGEKVVNPLVSILASTLTGKLLKEFTKELTRQKISSEIDLPGLELLLTGLSDGDFSNAASEYIVTVYGAGREYEAMQHAEQIEYILRSEILDNRICKACKPIDLKEVYPDDSLWNSISSGPYTQCEGGAKCRGINLYVTKE